MLETLADVLLTARVATPPDGIKKSVTAAVGSVPIAT